MIFKATTKSNISGITSLLNEAITGYDYMVSGESFTNESIIKLIERSGVTLFIIQDKDSGELAGYCLTYEKESKEFSHRAYIQAIAILPKYRGNGLGTKLLIHVIGWAKNNKKYSISLEVVSENTCARTLYESLGMVKVGEVPGGFYKKSVYHGITTYYLPLE